MKTRLNCWLVAMWIWVAGHARAAIWVKRSKHFGGLIPHFGNLLHVRGRYLAITDYAPPKDKLWTKDNILIAFTGQYRATIVRVVQQRRFSTRAEMMTWITTGSRSD